MTKRILYIIIGSALILILILGLWFWFFARGGSEAANPSGLFGTSGDATNAGAGIGDDQGNAQAPIGSNASQDAGGDISYVAPASNSGAVWLDGSGAGGGGGSGGGGGGGGAGSGGGSGGGGTAGIFFTPTPINSFNTFNPGGTIYIAATPGGADGGNNLVSGLLGVVGSCAANFLATKATGAVASTLDSAIGFFTGEVRTTDRASHQNESADIILQCITKALARIAIQQITNDTINWINSGFDGKPAFVQDFNKFFSDVADKAAGSVIQSGDFAFLCSPFKLQVRIAIAQSYARRSSGSSCSLSQVVGNVQNFANGDFSQGGWPGFLAFTTESTNNPFGGYIHAQLLVNDRIANDTLNEQRKLSPGGYFSQQHCEPSPVPGGEDICTIDTPGTDIAAIVTKVTGSTIDSLQLANSINDILNALMNALLTKVLYKGLANVGDSALDGSQDTVATQQANSLSTEIQSRVADAQSYASTEQGSVSDIQTAQQSLNTLQNCWLGNSSSKAKGKAADADDKIAELEVQVTVHNNRITSANSVIVSLQDVQTKLFNSSTLADVQAVASEYAALKAGGSLITATQITAAQQDRTTLQAQMSGINTSTQTQLQECYAAS